MKINLPAAGIGFYIGVFRFALVLLLVNCNAAIAEECDSALDPSPKDFPFTADSELPTEPFHYVLEPLQRSEDNPLYSQIANDSRVIVSRERGDEDATVSIDYGDYQFSGLWTGVNRSRGKHDKIIATYGESESVYQRTGRGGFHAIRNKGILPKAFFSKFFFNRLSQVQGRFLDFACGNGAITRDFRKAGVNMFGLDPLLPIWMHDPKIHPSHYFIQAPGQNTGLRGNLFEGVFALNSPLWSEHHSKAEEMIAMYQELFRIIKPGGFLVVAPVDQALLARALRTVPFRIYQTDSKRSEFLSRAKKVAKRETRYSYAVLEVPKEDSSETLLNQIYGVSQHQEEPRHYRNSNGPPPSSRFRKNTRKNRRW